MNMPNIDASMLTNEYFGNSLRAYLASLLIFACCVLFLTMLRMVFFKRLRKWVAKTPSKVDDMVVDILDDAVLPILYAAAFYYAANQLELNPAASRVIHGIFVVVMTIQVIRAVISAGLYILQNDFTKRGTGVTASKSIFTILKVVLWCVGFVFVLDNLGFDVNAVIAGLGIGGVAVALAAQTILGDLFNYFVIFFDKPFEEGDFVITGDVQGVIEHIGIKSTRIVSISGEQIVCSNTDLTSSRVRNFKRMVKRRVLFKVGVTYDTPIENLKKIPKDIKSIIESVPDTTFDRAHFSSFGDSNLCIETVYYVVGSDYTKYMDIQQRINFSLMERFKNDGIEFAFPTQTLYVKSDQIGSKA